MEHKYVPSEGPAKAAVLAAGIGSAMLGLLTTLTAVGGLLHARPAQLREEPPW